MNTSINEVAALAKKATRGAGYTWSMADEAAFATAWLCRNGLNGSAFLAAHLNQVHHSGFDNCKLQSLDAPWHGGPIGLCALSAGSTLSDLAQCKYEQSETLEKIISPELLLPFFAYVCQITQTKSDNHEQPLEAQIQCESFEATLVCVNRHAHLATFNAKHASRTINIGNVQYRYVLSANSSHAPPQHAPNYRTNIDLDTLNSLNQFANKTYAPATEASRQGAGAGNTDND